MASELANDLRMRAEGLQPESVPADRVIVSALREALAALDAKMGEK